MKKLIFYLAIITLFASCTINENMSIRQLHSIKHFHNKRRLYTFNKKTTFRYVPCRRRGELNNRMVTKKTRRTLIRKIQNQRLTVNKY